MKSSCRFIISTLIVFAITLGLANVVIAQAPAAAAKNLLAGVGGPIASTGSWSNYSTLSLMPGAAQFGVASPNTTLYIGFTAGSTAEIGNMVIYKTARAGSKITSVTPVKLGGVSNPIINLASTSVCPVQPVSVTSPCIIRLDPTVLSLSPLSDYYFTLYFPTSTNNSAIGSAIGSSARGSLNGWYIGGDESQLKTGQLIPAGNTGGGPYFLMYVMSN